MNQVNQILEMLPFTFQAEAAEISEEIRGSRGRSRRMPVVGNSLRSTARAKPRTNIFTRPGKNAAKVGRARTNKSAHFSGKRPASPYPTAQQNIYLMHRKRPYQRPQQGASQFIRWVQHRLNQLLGLRLPLSGRLSQQDRNALRRLQYICGLPVTGRLDMPSRSCLYQFKPLRRNLPMLTNSLLNIDADAGTDTGFDQDPPDTDANADISVADDADSNPAPDDASTSDADNLGDAAEIPSNLQHLLSSRPQLAKYADPGSGRSLQQVAADASLKGVGGVYLITFDDRGQRRAYSGTTSDLQRRLRQHLHCLKFPLGLQRSYSVYYEAIRNPVQARKKEAALNALRNSLGGSLVNLTTELEAELFV